MNPKTRSQWLAASGIRHYPRDIRSMSATELLAHFGSAASGRLVVTRLVRNLAYQAWQQIRAGTAPPIQGNIRSFWYAWVKPVLLRVPEQHRPNTDPDRTVSEALASLVHGRQLLSYADFGFTDENWRNRGIGLLRPHVIVFAEKAGQLRLLLRLHKRLGVSFLALGGLPSACTSEFTVRHLREHLATTALGVDAHIHLIGLVDYDPWGSLVAHHFRKQLTGFGLASTSLELIVGPELFTPSELAGARLPLKDSGRTTRWLDAGGGIDGEAWGLSVDSVPIDRLQAATEEAVLRLGPEAVTPIAADVDTSDPRWIEAINGPGGAANVAVVSADKMDLGAMALVKRGMRVVVVDDGVIVGVLGGGRAGGQPDTD